MSSVRPSSNARSSSNVQSSSSRAPAYSNVLSAYIYQHADGNRFESVADWSGRAPARCCCCRVERRVQLTDPLQACVQMTPGMRAQLGPLKREVLSFGWMYGDEDLRMMKSLALMANCSEVARNERRNYFRVYAFFGILSVFCIIIGAFVAILSFSKYKPQRQRTGMILGVLFFLCGLAMAFILFSKQKRFSKVKRLSKDLQVLNRLPRRGDTGFSNSELGALLQLGMVKPAVERQSQRDFGRSTRRSMSRSPSSRRRTGSKSDWDDDYANGGGKSKGRKRTTQKGKGKAKSVKPSPEDKEFEFMRLSQDAFAD